ncbi:MAG: hypothetical protein ACI9LV_000388 [Candidatus Nanohaloarchaea archaeon]|jgi:hypothetical protein
MSSGTSSFVGTVVDLEDMASYQGAVYTKMATLETSYGEEVKIFDKDGLLEKEDIGEEKELSISALVNAVREAEDSNGLKRAKETSDNWHYNITGTTEHLEKDDSDTEIILQVNENLRLDASIPHSELEDLSKGDRIQLINSRLDLEKVIS